MHYVTPITLMERCTAPTRDEFERQQVIEIRGLRRRVHLLEGHNQHFERCGSMWCNPGPGRRRPAVEMGTPDSWPAEGVKLPVNSVIEEQAAWIAELEALVDRQQAVLDGPYRYWPCPACGRTFGMGLTSKDKRTVVWCIECGHFGPPASNTNAPSIEADAQAIRGWNEESEAAHKQQPARISDLDSRLTAERATGLRLMEQVTALQMDKAAAPSLESRVASWVRTRIGESHMHRQERAMRLLEEALELAQAEGITREMVERQAGHVYERPAGDPAQEAAGVAVCLMAWCAATGNRLMELAEAEVARNEAKPLDQIRGSLARKADADLVVVVEEKR